MPTQLTKQGRTALAPLLRHIATTIELNKSKIALPLFYIPNSPNTLIDILDIALSQLNATPTSLSSAAISNHYTLTPAQVEIAQALHTIEPIVKIAYKQPAPNYTIALPLSYRGQNLFIFIATQQHTQLPPQASDNLSKLGTPSNLSDSLKSTEIKPNAIKNIDNTKDVK